jgi:hypothetical protein
VILLCHAWCPCGSLLPQELEKALSKHEIIDVKALAQKTKASPSSSSSGSLGRNSPAARSSTCSPGSSSSSSSRAIAEFKRGIRETEAEAAATQQRLQQLRDSKAQLEAATGGAAAAWRQLQQEQVQLRAETAQTQAARWVLYALCKVSSTRGSSHSRSSKLCTSASVQPAACQTPSGKH